MHDFLNHRWVACTLLVSGLGLALPGVAADDAAAESIERGRYLVQIGGCNDCHTPGYMLKDGDVPEAEWLTGDVFGWHGPWGTTYATNLRLLMSGMEEDAWVEMARTLRRKPPMPWFNLNVMHEDDLRAIYRYTRHLGPAGEPAPLALAPGVQPPGPHAVFPAPPPPQAAIPAAEVKE